MQTLVLFPRAFPTATATLSATQKGAMVRNVGFLSSSRPLVYQLRQFSKLSNTGASIPVTACPTATSTTTASGKEEEGNFALTVVNRQIEALSHDLCVLRQQKGWPQSSSPFSAAAEGGGVGTGTQERRALQDQVNLLVKQLQDAGLRVGESSTKSGEEQGSNSSNSTTCADTDTTNVRVVEKYWAEQLFWASPWWLRPFVGCFGFVFFVFHYTCSFFIVFGLFASLGFGLWEHVLSLTTEAGKKKAEESKKKHEAWSRDRKAKEERKKLALKREHQREVLTPLLLVLSMALVM